MIFEQKKEHILRCIKLGMELLKAQLIAECTEEEIEILNSDELFLKRIEQQYAIEEYNLLMKHNTALEISKLKGNANPIQWKLGKLNPSRWDTKDKSTELRTPVPIQVNLIGKGSEDT